MMGNLEKLANLYIIASLFATAQDARAAVAQLLQLIPQEKLRTIGELYQDMIDTSLPESSRAEAAHYLDSVIEEIKLNYADDSEIQTISNALDIIYNEGIKDLDLSAASKFEGFLEETDHEYHQVPIGQEEIRSGTMVKSRDYESRKERARQIAQRRYDPIPEVRQEYLRKQNEWFKKKRKEDEQFRKKERLITQKYKLKKNILDKLKLLGLSETESQKQIDKVISSVRDVVDESIASSEIELSEYDIKLKANEKIIEALKNFYENIKEKQRKPAISKSLQEKRSKLKFKILQILKASGFTDQDAKLKFDNDINKYITEYSIDPNDYSKVTNILEKYLEDLRNATKLLEKQNLNNKDEVRRVRNKVREIYFNKLKEQNPNLPEEELKETVRRLPVSDVDKLHSQFLEEAKERLSA